MDNENLAIYGTSKYLANVNTFDMEKGHHFIVLHVTADGAEEIKVSMNPTQGTVATLDESGVVILQMKDDKSQLIEISAGMANPDPDDPGDTPTVKNFTIVDMTFAEENNG